MKKALSRNQICDLITKEIRICVPRMDADDISFEKGFLEMGIESLQAVNIVDGLAQKLEIPLDITALFDKPNLNALTDYLIDVLVKREMQSSAGAKTDSGESAQYALESSIVSVEPLAIIGMSARFPGASNLDEYFKILSQGIGAVKKQKHNRWSENQDGTVNYFGAISDYESFAADVFGISDAEAVAMDPQQRLLMEEVWRAIEDAGVAPLSVRGSETGVFIGISSHDYSYADSSGKKNIFSVTGNSQSIAANRISYFYDLKGPSLAIDTACSSSLVALDSAVKALQNKDIDMAIVGGVNLILKSELSQAFADATMLSPDGQCKTFSDDANGYVRGEGVGVVILKRRSDAEKAGHRIYAEVLSVAVNQDGKSSSLTAPNGTAQENVIRQALKKARLSSKDIVFHEAHGTGTSVGDPIEGMALERVHSDRDLDQPLLISSAKTNIGHLEAAAGIAGFIKVALSIYHKTLFPSLNFRKLNSLLENKIPHLKVNTQVAKYSTDKRMIGSVSSFGFGGTNSHAILAQYGSPQAESIEVSQFIPDWAFGGFSNNDRTALVENVKVLRKELADQSWLQIQSALNASLTQRMGLREQVIFYASLKEQLLSVLDDIIAGRPNTNYQWALKAKSNIKAAILFTGQGSQFTGMFKDLYRERTDFKKSVDVILYQAQKYFDLNLHKVWMDPSLVNDLNQTNYSQILTFAGEYSLAKILVDTFQLKFDFVFGHSLGEIIAATISGALAVNDAVELVCRRGWFMRKTDDGAMLAVFASLEKIYSLAKSVGAEIDLAANNGPELQVISGPVSEIEKLEAVLSRSQTRSQRLPVKQAFHSSLMEPILDLFTESIESLPFSAPTNAILVSSLTGSAIDTTMNAEYWKKQLRNSTQFEKAMLYLQSQDCRVFIEIGPKPTLTGMAQRFLKTDNSHWVSFTDIQSMGKSALRLAQMDLFKNSPFKESTPTLLPKTEFKKNKYWITGAIMENKTTSSPDIILGKLAEIMAATMRVPVSEINVNEPLIDFGADSLVLLNAVQVIKDTYHVAIPISEVFKDLNTLRKIAQYIAEQTATVTTTTASEQAPAEVPTPAPVSQQIPMAAMPTLAPMAPVSMSGDLVSLLNNQLSIIQNQIQLLAQGGSVAKPLSVASAQTVLAVSTATPAASDVQIETLEKEKRGVLGNFKSFATVEKSEEDTQTKKEFLKNTIATVNHMTQKTKTHVQQYRKQLADNRVSAGFRPNTKEMIYPIHCYQAKGSHFVDLDGNTFLDFTMGFGVNLFGHSPDFLDQAMKDQFDLGVCVGPQSHLAGPVADLFCRLTGQERVAFVNSGTEAVMTAIRLARAATKRTKIVLFDGSYHGHFDGVLAKGTKNITSMPVAAGITQNMVDDIIVLEYGNPKSLEIIRSRASELAAVIVEPVQSRFPEMQPKEFLKEIRKITQDSGTAFIWDEVITGFRIAPGGAQEHFGIKADLASYGKVLGGGMPIGAIGGSAKFLDFIDGGYWEFGNDSMPENEMTFFAGTFSKHPLAMATAYATLKKIDTEGKEIIGKLNAVTDNLVQRLNTVFERRSLDIKVYNFGTLFRFKGNLNLDLLFAKLLEKGIYIWEGRNCFISTAHTEEDLKTFIKAVEKSCDELQKSKFYPPPKELIPALNENGPYIELTPFQQRFMKLHEQGGPASSANNICVSAKVKGELDVTKLQEAIEYIVQKRDIFKWCYSQENRSQYFQSVAKPVDMEFINLRAIERPWKILDKQLNDLSKTQFDLEKQSPMLVKIYDVVEETHLMAVITHHMAFDGWSMTLFFEDLATVYNAMIKGQEPVLRPAYSFEQLLKNPPAISTTAEDILVHKYNGTETHTLFDSGPADKSDFEGERIVFDIELKVFEALKRWCKQNKVTPFMLLMAGFTKVLMDHFNKKVLTMAIPAANRDVMGTEVMYGNCANLVPVTLENNADSILKFVFQAKERMIEGYQTMSYPYELLKAKTGDLFDVYFNLEPTSDLPEFDNASLLIHPFVISSSEFPLMLNVTDFEHYYHCEMDFQKKFISDDAVLKIIETLRKKLRAELLAKAQEQKIT